MPEYRFATRDDVPKIETLLRKNKLPTDGVEKHFSNFIIAVENDKPVGAVGLEIYDETALFRSLVVDRDFRSQQIGKALIERIKTHALANKVKELYLLTTTAKDYFLRLGFAETERNNAPQHILNTEEFKSLCPSSAICMLLHIKNRF